LTEAETLAGRINMQRILLLVLMLAAAPTARAECTSEKANTINTCFAALTQPSGADMTPCISAAGTNGTCMSALWCPYFKAQAACYVPECCELLSDAVALVRQGWNTTFNSMGVTCDATICAGGSVASAAAATSVPLAALAAAHLAALVATRW